MTIETLLKEPILPGKLPILFDLAAQWADEGLTVLKSYDFWDVSVGENRAKPAAVAKMVRKIITPRQAARILSEKSPHKLIIYEHPEVDMGSQWANFLYLSKMGASAYVNGRGWVVTPHVHPMNVPEDAALRQSTNWQARQGGHLVKKCRGPCGLWKGRGDFPKHGVPGRRDPYRALCKVCYAAAKTAARHSTP